MDRNSAYVNLAEWFEYLNDDCDYEKWSQYFIQLLSESNAKTGLDVGCGAGWFTRAFQRAGYQMTGMDCSLQMLDVAQRKALKEGVRSEYILGDIAAKKTGRRYGFVTAINDCFNYVPKKKLLSAFKNVYASLEKNGLFLFDISSERKMREKIANTVNVDDRDDVTYLNFCKADGDEVTMDVTLFVRQADGRYVRMDERHVQYVYREEEIVETLEKAGFVLERVEGHLGEDKTLSDRLMFIARRG